MDMQIPLDKLLLYGIGAMVTVIAFFVRRTLTSIEESIGTLNKNVQAFESTVRALENRIAVIDGEDARKERHRLKNQVQGLILWRASSDPGFKQHPENEE